MLDLPNGTVTLLFTDIEAPTRLLQRLGEAYATALDDQRRILRDAVAATAVERSIAGATSSSLPFLARATL